MPLRYWLFPSVAGDRVYFADDFVRTHRDILMDGYVPGLNDELEVVPTAPVTLGVRALTGAARILGYRLEVYLDPEVVSISTPDSNNDRIDRVVVRLRRDETNRDMIIAVKTGTPAANPVPPPLTRDSDTHEISLAQVLVRANAIQIDAEDITDERDNPDVCGVAGPRATIVQAKDVPQGRVLTSQGDDTSDWEVPSAFANMRVFTSDGIFTVPDGVTKVLVELVGGGASGRGFSSTVSASNIFTYQGGGAGGYAKGIKTVAPNEEIPVTIGAGGAGNTGDGNPGGTTSFGSYLSATGGISTSLPGEGVGDIDTDLLLTGQRGEDGSWILLNLSTELQIHAIGGGGGDTPFGYGGQSTGNVNSAERGKSAIGYGSAGGSSAKAYNYDPTTDYPGGSGRSGLVIVRW